MIRSPPRQSFRPVSPLAGAQELLLHGRDPYSSQVTREIQVGYYGRELDPARPHDPKDQQGFAYPVYVAFLLSPFVYLDFSLSIACSDGCSRRSRLCPSLCG